MSSIHELLKQVYPLKLRMELFNAIWTNWREDVKEKDQRIAELEEQLRNAIVLPKYEKGQKIYCIVGKNIKEAYFQSFTEDVSAEVISNPQEITDEDGFIDVDFDIDMIYYKNIFATKEEAQAKLEELQGEKR